MNKNMGKCLVTTLQANVDSDAMMYYKKAAFRFKTTEESTNDSSFFLFNAKEPFSYYVNGKESAISAPSGSGEYSNISSHLPDNMSGVIAIDKYKEYTLIQFGKDTALDLEQLKGMNRGTIAKIQGVKFRGEIKNLAQIYGGQDMLLYHLEYSKDNEDMKFPKGSIEDLISDLRKAGFNTCNNISYLLASGTVSYCDLPLNNYAWCGILQYDELYDWVKTSDKKIFTHKSVPDSYIEEKTASGGDWEGFTVVKY